MSGDDEIRVFPLSGFAIDTLSPGELLAKFRIVPHPDAIRTGERHVVPVRMTLEQARALADVLTQAADAVDREDGQRRRPN